MIWRKLGRIFQASGQYDWMQSHTSAPIALTRADGTCRIYIGSRDRENHPRIGYVDIHLDEPTCVLAVSEQPVLSEGPPGWFDDNGVYPGGIVDLGDEIWMYYLGRSNGQPPLFYMSIGLAISRDGGATFEKVRRAPLLGRSDPDPWMVSTPCVLREKNQWRMWYLSGLRWGHLPDGSVTSYYHIKYAESADGLEWVRDGRVCIDLKPGETNVASPTVLQTAAGYAMWYSAVDEGKQYAIGYAESANGLDWIRKDHEVQFTGAHQPWDAHAMAYPCVVSHAGRQYLIYSGNGYGRDGFGIAISEPREAR